MTKSIYLKILGGIAAAAFTITSAVLIGNRLSTEAMAVLAGAVCGVGAAIPTSLLIIAVTQRRAHQAETTPAPRPQFTPPIVMMTPPVQIQPATPTPPPATWEDAPIQRHFTVVGGETE
jgi:hypothetical protein